jgi:hypothetical protein
MEVFREIWLEIIQDIAEDWDYYVMWRSVVSVINCKLSTTGWALYASKCESVKKCMHMCYQSVYDVTHE